MKDKTVKKSAAEKRREAILDAGLELFLKKGYSAVSVDEIIRKSGGSKSSVYEYFGTKEGLFKEIISKVAEEVMKPAKVPSSEGRTPREVLTALGNSLCNQVLNDTGIGLYRLAVSSSVRFPKVARVFYDAGPGHNMKAIAEYLKKEADAGRLRIKDPMRASYFFSGMLLVRDHIAMPLGCLPPPSREEIREMVDEAVDVFMAAYGV